MTTTVPRRHRRDHREATQNLEDEFSALEHQAAAELARLPVPAERERVPLRERDRLPVARPIHTNPRGELGWLAGYVWNRIGHHFWRLDLHARTFACSAGRGARRAAGRGRDYLRMPKRLLVLERLVAEGETKKHAKFAASYEQRRKARSQKVAVAAGGTALALAAAVVVAGWPLTAAVLVVVGLPVLAVYGRRRPGDKTPGPVLQVTARPVPKTEPRPTVDQIHAAFDAAGIPGVVSETAPHREGPGWETLVQIPVGRDTFDTATAKRVAIAGNLGVSRERLFLDPVKGNRGSEKHVLVWKADVDPMAGDPPPHPLMDPSVTSWDLWNRGWPIGIDPRGRQILVPVVDTPHGAVGARGSAGKTFTMFGCGVAAGLDPLFDLDIVSFKPSDDFAPLKPLVKACGGTYIVGSDPDAFKAFHRYLTELRTEVAERNRRLGSLPVEAVPHGKVTRELAMDPRMGMRPRVVLCDEIQTPLTDPRDPKLGSRILAELIESARTFRSQNIWFLFGFQFVDAASVEQLVRLLGMRLALSVARWEDSKGILGGAHTPGVADASEIPLSRKGVGILAGAEDDPNVGDLPAKKMRTYGIESRSQLAEHTKRCLAGPRAGQSPAVQLGKADAPVVARLRAVRNGDRYLDLGTLAVRLGYGDGLGGRRKAAADARAAGIEPATETRDDGVVARGAQFVDLGALNGHHG